MGNIRSALGKCAAWVASVALVATMLTLVPVAPAVADPDPVPEAAEKLSVTKKGPDSALVGNTITYELTAYNDGEAGVYNLTFRDVLPPGVEYVKTISPAGLGEPSKIRVFEDPEATDPQTDEFHWVLIWDNVSDLPEGAKQTIRYEVKPDSATYPVGAQVDNTADAYASLHPRMVPKFDSEGETTTAEAERDNKKWQVFFGSASQITPITAIEIEKFEASPENELVRGVHDNHTVYRLKITNNGNKKTENLEVIDYLPAELEFLGCVGAEDNTSATNREYGDREIVVTADGGDCIEPETVETVAGGTAGAPDDSDVYTKVTWTLPDPDLEASQQATITYAAAIAQRANTLDFQGATPDAASGKQAANLDNNTGRSTRELASQIGSEDGEISLTNHAVVTGSYQGPDIKGAGPVEVSDETSLTVTAEDIALHKAVSPGKFKQNELATYTLTVRTSEYTDASAITIWDRIPNGLCPVASDDSTVCANEGEATNFTVTATTNTGPVTIDVADVTQEADGSWLIELEPVDLDYNGQLTITYEALMLPQYRDSVGDPTVSGDNYTNRAWLEGTTTVRSNVEPPAGDLEVIEQVGDKTFAVITSGGPQLTKTIATQTTPASCSAGDYVRNNGDNPVDPTNPDLTFGLGDEVCFTVHIQFDQGSMTKHPVLTDLLPDGLSFLDAEATTNNQVAVDGNDPTEDDGVLTWRLGRENSSGFEPFVNKGAVFEWRIRAEVEAVPDTEPDITGNLAKLTWVDTNNQVGFLRDQVDFSVSAVPPVAITKHHDAAGRVIGGEAVTYTLKVTNEGTAANRNNVDIHNIKVRDELPHGITCDDVDHISPPGACADAEISWTVTGPLGPIEETASNELELSYELTIPGNPGINTVFDNIAFVDSYDTIDNRGGIHTHEPEVSDNARVRVRNAGVTKTQTTSVAEQNNNRDDQATLGEQVVYTIEAAIPARTTIYNATLTDPLVAGLILDPATAATGQFSSDDGDTWQALPHGVNLETVDDLPTLAFGDSYTNVSNSDELFRLVIPTIVQPDRDATKHGQSLRNTATLTSTVGADSTSPAQTVADNSTIRIVEPSPSLGKTHDAGQSAVGAGQELTYTLTVGNAANRPPLHNAVVVDCVPAGLEFAGFEAVPAGVTATKFDAGDSNNECADSGATQLVWDFTAADGTDVPINAGADARVELTYLG